MYKVETTSKGMKVVANLFISNGYKEGDKRPVTLVAPAATAVNENAAHKYAERCLS